IHGPCSSLASRLPEVSKMATKPRPAPATSSCLSASCFAKVTTRLSPTACTLKGTKLPAASPSNAPWKSSPFRGTRWKLVSYISIRPLWKLATNRKRLPSFSPIVAPLHGVLLRVVHDQHGVRVHCGVPAGDGAVFGDKDEAGRLGRRQEKVRGAAVKYGAGGRGWRRFAPWRRDRDAEQLGAG